MAVIWEWDMPRSEEETSGSRGHHPHSSRQPKTLQEALLGLILKTRALSVPLLIRAAGRHTAGTSLLVLQ